MSEYIEIEFEVDDLPDRMWVYTNLKLGEAGVERYASAETLSQGSPVAQLLSDLPGLVALTIDGDSLLLQRDPDTEWYALVEDVSALLKEFFL